MVIPDKYKSVLREVAWLLGSWAFSFGLVWRLGGKYAGTLDIQMHNTYVVLPVWGLATLIFLVLAPVITSARVLAGRGRHVAASVVLAALSGVWLLIILAVVVVRIVK
jgi:hypothetical protein